MGLTRSDIFTDKQNELADLAKVLGHPARIAILQHLIKVNTCIGGDLVNEIGLAQPTISQHLKELKRVGIIQGTIEGTSICYCINPQNWKIIQSLFDTFFTNFISKIDSNLCC
jgi:DNA-binding transcriptional ArsR family regulator